jgi:hypothetical protein
VFTYLGSTNRKSGSSWPLTHNAGWMAATCIGAKQPSAHTSNALLDPLYSGLSVSSSPAIAFSSTSSSSL